jgi:hemerythrin-like domain-containing protein
MDPIALIKEDHRRVEALFEEYEALDEEAYTERGDVVNVIMEELEAHMEMEESIAYPIFQQALSTEDDKKVEEGYAEHDVAKNIIEELRALDPQDVQFGAKVTVLKENIMHHVEEEESEILPTAEEALSGDEMARIGEEMHAFKDARDDEAIDALTSGDDL